MFLKAMAAECTFRLLPPTVLCATPARGYRQLTHARLSGREFLVLGLRHLVIPSQHSPIEFFLSVNSVSAYRARIVAKSISNQPRT